MTDGELTGMPAQMKYSEKEIKLPDKVNILGIEYSIIYLDKPSEVDWRKRESLWGQIDYWTRIIRVFNDGNRPVQDIWQTIFHEILHAICSHLHLKSLSDDNIDHHNELDIVALALVDILFRNNWLNLKEGE